MKYNKIFIIRKLWRIIIKYESEVVCIRCRPMINIEQAVSLV